MVHRREVNGHEINLGNHGALYKNAMTWWDHDTGSIWSQPTGEAILGPRKGARLELLPSTLTPWSAWREAHPDTLALDFGADAAGYALDDMLIVVDLGDEAVGFPFPTVRRLRVVNATVSDVPVAVVTSGGNSDRWAVFLRRLNERTLDLGMNGAMFVDEQTGTEWDPVSGVAMKGPLAGERLDVLPAFTEFAPNFEDHFQDGRIWSP